VKKLSLIFIDEVKTSFPRQSAHRILCELFENCAEDFTAEEQNKLIEAIGEVSPEDRRTIIWEDTQTKKLSVHRTWLAITEKEAIDEFCNYAMVKGLGQFSIKKIF
jgi:hypothetical protein